MYEPNFAAAYRETQRAVEKPLFSVRRTAAVCLDIPSRFESEGVRKAKARWPAPLPLVPYKDVVLTLRVPPRRRKKQDGWEQK